MDGVFMEEAITKVMRNNKIFVVVTNTNPYPVCLKPSQSVGQVTDTSQIQIIPVHEARIASFGDAAQTGPVAVADLDKLQYLKENFNCPLDSDPGTYKQYEDLIMSNHDVFARDKFDLGFFGPDISQNHNEGSTTCVCETIPDTRCL